MDARDFKFDDPPPRTCKHCKWGEWKQEEYVGLTLTCKNQKALEERSPSLVPTGVYVGASETCDQWEEKP